MGVLQRFERRLEGLVEGAFARAFGGEVQPVEIAGALQREAADRKAIVSAGRVLVPNDYAVELGPADAERLGPYDDALSSELASVLREHAEEQGWSFVGPVHVRLERKEDLETGLFRVRSAVLTPQPPAAGPTGPALVISSDGVERRVPLRPGTTVIGRGEDAHVRLPDTGVSRRHAELYLADADAGAGAGAGAILQDLGSTNGTTVNGRPVGRHRLEDGDTVQIGTSVLVFRRQG